jgi:hypothetical protein
MGIPGKRRPLLGASKIGTEHHMECHLEANERNCACTYPCKRRGKCCECVQYHRKQGELPGCFFPKSAEAGYDRSIANFIRCHGK